MLSLSSRLIQFKFEFGAYKKKFEFDLNSRIWFEFTYCWVRLGLEEKTRVYSSLIMISIVCQKNKDSRGRDWQSRLSHNGLHVYSHRVQIRPAVIRKLCTLSHSVRREKT